MLKKLSYFLLTILLLITIAGLFGIRWFNNMWFKDSPNHLSITSDSSSIHFEWAEDTLGGYFEQHAAIVIPATIRNMPNKFYFQFDTGASSTLLY